MNSVRIERNQPQKSNVTLTGFAWLYAALAVCLTLFSLYLTCMLHWQGAFRDLWEFVDDIARQFQGVWSAAYLLDAYGGAHRLFFPKLLFFADYYWLSGRNDLTTAVALLCQAIYAAIIWRATRTTSWSYSERTILLSLLVLALFSTTQVSNFLYAMDVQWYMSNTLALISLYALAYCEDSIQKWLTVIVFGTIAALCNFTGLMPLLISILTLLILRNKKHIHYFLLLLLSAICILYMHNDKNSTHVVINALQHSNSMVLSLGIILKTLGDMAVYVPRYLSSPMSREWPIAGSTLAIVGMTTTLYYWVYYFRHPCRVNVLQKLCLYLSTCIIVSAAFTAFGRVIYPNSATAERYQTLVLPWFPSLFGLVWSDIRHRKQRALYLAVWSAIFFCYLLPTQPVSAKNMVILSSRVHLAHTAARAGVLEPPYILATLSYPLIKNNINSVKDNDIFLRSHTLGYFQNLPQFSLGERLPTINAPPCAGNVSSRLDAKAQAWIFDGQLLINTQQAATDIVITQNNIIKGLGILIGSDDSLLPATRQDAQQTRFRAFAHQTALNLDTATTLWGIRKGVIQCQMSLPKLMP